MHGSQAPGRPPARHFPLYIGGELVDTEDHAYGMSVRTVLDPTGDGTTELLRLLREGTDEELHAHPDVLCSAALSTSEHGRQALRAAAAAVPALRATSLDERFSCIEGLHRRFVQHREELAWILRQEGCPRLLAEAQLNSVLEFVRPDSLRRARTQLRQEITSERHRVVLQRQPDGVVCIDPPANSPLFGLVASLVLLAGNAVVVRVPRSCIGSLSYALHSIIIPALQECGFPAGAVNVLCADFEATMRQWLDSDAVDSIYYFGSTEYGLDLERRCLQARKKAILELSGNDGVLVWRDADLDGATAALLECFHASGQTCFSPKYVLAHPDIADQLLDRLSAAAQRLQPGDPEESDTVLSPVLRPTAFRRHLDDATAAGATLVCGGTRVDVRGHPDGQGLFIEPAVLRVDGLSGAEDVPAVREETFFPLLSVVVPEDGPDVVGRCVDFLNRNDYGLRNSLWAEDVDVIERFSREVSNGGHLTVNDSHMGHVPYTPGMGGTGCSGGAHGEAAYPFMRASRLQAVTVATDRADPETSLLGDV